MLAVAALAAGCALAPAAPADAYVYFGESFNRVARAERDGTGITTLTSPVQGVTSLALQGRQLYWGDAATGAIGRVGIDGAGAEPELMNRATTGGVHGLTTTDTHLFWINWDQDKIGRADLDGGNADPGYIDISSASGNALVADGTYLYWARTTGIARARLDGSDLEPTFIELAEKPLGIAVDDQHVYWTFATGAIGRVRRDGSDADPAWITGGRAPGGIAVDDRHVWWINRGTNAIGRANLDGTDVDQAFVSSLNGTYAIAVDQLPVEPRLTLAWRSADVVLGDEVSLAATLDGADAPTGSLELAVYGPDDPTCSGRPVLSRSAPAADGVVTGRYTPSEVGVHRWRAWYDGDVANRAFASACVDFDVAPMPWTLSLTAAPRALVGMPIDAAALLAPAGTASGRSVGPGDAVLTFALHGPDDPTCAQPPAFSDAVALGAAIGGSHPSGAFVPRRAGAYRWTASLAATGNAADPVPCADGPVVAVERRTPTLELTPSPAVALGGDVHATVDLAGSYAADGELVFALHGPDDPTCAAAPVFRTAVAADGDGAYRSGAYAPRAVGTYRWVRVVAGERDDGRRRDGAAAGALRLRLQPALYRITVRARTADGLSAPARRFLRVLAPRG